MAGERKNGSANGFRSARKLREDEGGTTHAAFYEDIYDRRRFACTVFYTFNGTKDKAFKSGVYGFESNDNLPWFGSYARDPKNR